MSKDTKENAQQIKRFLESFQDGAKKAREQASKFDKVLSDKISKVEEASKEVVRYVEKKSE
jgi:methyl-accepting chemotaxis protein